MPREKCYCACHTRDGMVTCTACCRTGSLTLMPDTVRIRCSSPTCTETTLMDERWRQAHWYCSPACANEEGVAFARELRRMQDAGVDPRVVAERAITALEHCEDRLSRGGDA